MTTIKLSWLLLASVFHVQVAVGQVVTCASTFRPTFQVVISPDRINDGYCDCPLDGLDEPETEACSGSVVGGWAGFARNSKQDGYVCYASIHDHCVIMRARPLQ
jgi:hypothetical protein